MIKSVMNIEAPRPHVYAILADFSRYNEWLPGCVRSKIVSDSANTVETEFTLSGIKTMTLGLRYLLEPNEHLNYRLVKGKDLKTYEGSWRLMDSADGSGTVVVGEMEMDVGGVPAFVLARMAKKAIDDVREALRKRARELPVAPPVGTAAAAAAVAPPPRKHKRILHVMRIGGGYRVWMMGETYFLRR
ncbi:MAG: SRPBCC family protein [Acidobacteria bacterium]|nr:SRPBCC family protein [Acidobacteriota bacterium]